MKKLINDPRNAVQELIEGFVLANERCQTNVEGVYAVGDIVPGLQLAHRGFAQGNIHRDSFMEVWNSRYQLFRDRSWMRRGACGSCKD